MEIEFIVQLSVLGIVVGFVAGLLGVGGGGILVPLLTSLYLSADIVSKHAVHLALGTSLASIIMTTFSSVLSHYKNQNIDWASVKMMAPLVAVGAVSISFLLPFINTSILAFFFSIFMFSMSIKLMLNRPHTSTKKATISPLLVAWGIGSLSTLVAISGVALMVPYLNGRGLEMRRAIGSSAAIGFLMAICGTIGYAINGDMSSGELLKNHDVVGFVHIPTVIIISIFGFIMAPVGVRLSAKLPVAVLRKMFAVLLVCLSVKMLMSVTQ